MGANSLDGVVSTPHRDLQQLEGNRNATSSRISRATTLRRQSTCTWITCITPKHNDEDNFELFREG